MSKVLTPFKPGWVNKDLPESFYNDPDNLKIIGFFVVHAFRPFRSSKGKTIHDYGWPKNVWKNSSSVGLKDLLIYTAGLHYLTNNKDIVTGEPILESTFCSCNNLNDMSSVCNNSGCTDRFTQKRKVNRIAVYNSENNVMLSVFDHIRNSLAHGRFTIYDDGMIAMESVKMTRNSKESNHDEVHARLLLSKKTLLQWIDIIRTGYLDEKIVKEIENKRAAEKEKRRLIRRNEHK